LLSKNKADQDTKELTNEGLLELDQENVAKEEKRAN
jgi:hypothetical protein